MLRYDINKEKLEKFECGANKLLIIFIDIFVVMFIYVILKLILTVAQLKNIYFSKNDAQRWK